MACSPCQKRAEARRRALMEAAIQQNPAIQKSFTPTVNSYSDMPRVLPRHEGEVTNTLPREEIQAPSSTPTVWNEGYAAFMANRWK